MKRTHLLIAATAVGAAALAGAAGVVDAATAPKKAAKAPAKVRTARPLSSLAAPSAVGPKETVVLQKPVIKSISSPSAGTGAATGHGFDDDGSHHDGSHHDASEGADD